MTPLDPIGAMPFLPPSVGAAGVAAPAAPGMAAFDAILGKGLDAIEQRLTAADALVQRFALGDEIPLHQVTLALEQARLSVELAMEVRGRLLEGYREFMGMQI